MEIKDMTEADMRDAKVPWPQSEEELIEYVVALVNKKHDYGTCVYAMSMAAEAAYNYVAHKLGVTGFQASCADMDFIRRTRNIKGGFKQWLADEARKLLAEKSEYVHPDVLNHWKMLAGRASTPNPEARGK